MNQDELKKDIVNEIYQMQDRLILNNSKLVQQADNMAAAASTFANGGYDSFIIARKEFEQTMVVINNDMKSVKELQQQYCAFSKAESLLAA